MPPHGTNVAYQNAAPDEKKSLHVLSDLLEQCQHSATQANDALDRTLGLPPPSAEPALRSAPSGFLGEIEERLRNLRDSLDRVADRTNRIA
jgi:hypothetical protein